MSRSISRNQNEAPRLLITAGPTHEPIDAVRYLGNRSSGRMGLAIAAAAARRGLPVTLLLGPVPPTPPESSAVVVRRFRTAAELKALMKDAWPNHDVLIMAAAVADYRPKGSDERSKIRRQAAGLTLELEAIPDLLMESATTARPDQAIVGFALEPAAELDAGAVSKLKRKGIDAIVANPLETMDSDRVTATLILASGRSIRPPADLAKADFADWLLDRLPAIRGRDE
jgi:phosphopantothenoylcysteine decarboxylase/phosphopantothenate--cysteine ligase